MTKKKPSVAKPARAPAAKAGSRKPHSSPKGSAGKTSAKGPTSAKKTPASAKTTAPKTKAPPAPVKKAPALVKAPAKPPAAPVSAKPPTGKSHAPKTKAPPAPPTARFGAAPGSLYRSVKPEERPQRPVLSEDDLRKLKSGLTKKDLEHYETLLWEKRAEILGDVDSIQSDQKSKEGGNLSNMPLHMADIGTENYDQEFNLSLVESERKLLREILEALQRLKKGYYGLCVETGQPINKARLDIKPWAKYCIEVARERERRGEHVL